MERNTGSIERSGLKNVTEDIWIFDADPIRAAGAYIPLRMTVVRLSNGDLLIHSPVQYSSALQSELERLGPIRYLLAPSIGHWMFLRDWQAAVAGGQTFAVPGLASRGQVKLAGVRIDQELGNGTPAAMADDLETVLVSAPLFSEIEIFDKRSRTLILTDIVQNLDPAQLGSTARTAARLLGVTKPGGKAPIYLRLLLRRGGRSVRAAAEEMVRLAPRKVIFAHGDWFEADAVDSLRHSLRWLLPVHIPAHSSEGEELAGTRVVITGASSVFGRAAALAVALMGATVILAARRHQTLDRPAAECNALGGRALSAPTDVTNAEAVQQLASKADETFGGIDVWINNAGTGVFGPYQAAEMALHRRTLEVNLLGTMNGAFAVLPIFIRQKRGVLINNISIGGWTPTPLCSSLHGEQIRFARVHLQS
jgi:hypothetical protein